MPPPGISMSAVPINADGNRAWPSKATRASQATAARRRLDMGIMPKRVIVLDNSAPPRFASKGVLSRPRWNVLGLSGGRRDQASAGVRQVGEPHRLARR